VVFPISRVADAVKKRVVIILISLILIGSGLFLWRGNVWSDLIEMQRLKQDEMYTYLYKTPVHIDMSAPPTSAASPTISALGLQFNHQLGEPIRMHEEKDRIELRFPEKNLVIAKLEKGRFGFDDEMTESQRKQVAEVYGEKTMASGYHFVKKALELTPDNFSLFTLTSNKVLKANLVLLDMKLRMPIQSEVFTFETPHIRAIQIDQITKVKAFYVFDSEDDESPSYEVGLIGSFTKEEIEQIFGTMGFVKQ
jgi:hypothetical protein